MGQKKTTGKYTSVSLVVEFLRGNLQFFVMSIITSMVVAGLEMISPQLIRTTVDSVIGTEELNLPTFALEWVVAIGGVAYFFFQYASYIVSFFFKSLNFLLIDSIIKITSKSIINHITNLYNKQ